MQVPLLDLKLQYAGLREEIRAAIDGVLDSQQFILGPKVEELEHSVAAYCNCAHAVGVSSGTDALLIALMSAGVGAGDRVVTTPYTFFATAGAIARLGARPVFVDIRRDTYNMDPVLLEQAMGKLEGAQRETVRAIVPVHLFGQCADMAAICTVAERYGLTVIEDAAQAIGAEYGAPSGKRERAGSMGTYGCFSFFPSKNLGAFGDAGMVTARDETVAEDLRVLRVHGSKPKYHHRRLGGNFRLDALQAAVLSVKLKYLDGWTEQRRRNADLYRQGFRASDLPEVELPVDMAPRHIYNQFVIRVPERRDELRQALQAAGIGTEVYYPVPLHMQRCFDSLGYREEDFAESAAAARTTVALPIYPELTADQISYVVENIREFYRGGR